ncbi:MAG: 3-dehydroquinate synthase [Paludibacteraceae bacterium]|nr:3-dehydroquinate synthase [Paludibacteraceae bacterium]
MNNTITNYIARYDRQEVYFVTDAALHLNVQPRIDIVADEQHKCLETVQQIWDFLLSHHATRKALVVCVGGGVISDLGGFAAATYRRGIDYVNIPTTLLAMVDAATGGKTGCNYQGLKNAIGVICEPLDTIIMPQWLKTLPQQEILNGYAELIKTALITDADEYIRLLQLLDGDDLDADRLSSHIEWAVSAKKQIVSQDPNEQGRRKVLNFGHTIGHALESSRLTMHDAQLPHGYAVLYGMVAELYLSVVKLGLDREVLRQMSHVMVEYFGRPQCSCKDYDRLLRLMQDDKKNEQAGEINFTLLRAVGDPVINCTATEEEIKEALDYLFSI